MTYCSILNGLRSFRCLPGAAAAALPLSLLAACNGPAAPPKATVEIPVPVRTAVAVQQNVPITVKAIGWVEPFQTVVIKPQIEGMLDQIHFEQGQDVKQGDLLFTIDQRPLQAAVREAEAALERDRTMAIDAGREVKRLTDLQTQNISTERELEAARAEEGSRLAQSRVDEALLEAAKIRLEYTQLRAPFDGVMGTRMVDRGNVLKANEGALVQINQVQPIYVRFAVAEQQLGRLRSQMTTGDLEVLASVPGDDGPPEVGRLDFLDNQVDTATGMIRMKARFANVSRRLWPGRYANVSLVVSQLKDAVLVPTEALQDSQQGAALYVVNDEQRAELRPVTVGPVMDKFTVISHGVVAGETIVTDGQLRIVSGTKIGSAAASQPADPASQPASQPDSNGQRLADSNHGAGRP